MRTETSAVAAFAALVLLPAATCQAGDEWFNMLTSSGDFVYVNVTDQYSEFTQSSGRSDWRDIGLTAHGSTLDVYNYFDSRDFLGSIDLPSSIVEAGRAGTSFLGNDDQTAGVMLDDGSFHLFDIDDMSDGAESIGTIPQLPEGALATDFFIHNGRLSILDIGNDQMLHYDFATLEFKRAIEIGYDLGPDATFTVRRRFNGFYIADGLNSGWLYMFREGVTTPVMDLSEWGGAVGMTGTPTPGTLVPLCAALLLARTRRR